MIQSAGYPGFYHDLYFHGPLTRFTSFKLHPFRKPAINGNLTATAEIGPQKIVSFVLRSARFFEIIQTTAAGVLLICVPETGKPRL